MAWNDPGGGKDDDPWGGRRGEQGPPDLDEAFRKLQQQLAGMFGGGGGGGGGSRGGLPRLSGGVLLLLVAVLAVVYVISGIYTVDQQERGVVFRFGAVQDELREPGVQWYPRLIDRVVKVNVTQVRSSRHQALMLTEDENIVDVSVTVQYVVDDPVKFVVEVRSPEESLRQSTESALRHVIGSTTMDAAITEGRALIAVEVQRRLQSYMNRYGTGIAITKVNVDQSGPPAQVQAAFDDVQKAKEDEVRFKNLANAYAEGVIPTARGEAQKEIEQANAYRDRVVARARGEAERFNKLYTEYKRAPAVTRDRLYLDAMETVLQNSTKVLIDVDGGNNILYLPLDKIVQQSGASQAALPVNRDMVRDIANEVVRELQVRSSPRREAR